MTQTVGIISNCPSYEEFMNVSEDKIKEAEEVKKDIEDLHRGANIVCEAHPYITYIITELYLSKVISGLTIYFPCGWTGSMIDTCWKTPSSSGHYSGHGDGGHYAVAHGKFSEKMFGDEDLLEKKIEQCMLSGAKFVECMGGERDARKEILKNDIDRLIWL